MSEYGIGWIAAAVESIKSPRIKSMALHILWEIGTPEIVDQLPDTVRTRWLVLDRAFAGYLAAHSLKLKVIAEPGIDGETLDVRVEQLLPNLFEKGMLEIPRVVQA